MKDAFHFYRLHFDPDECIVYTKQWLDLKQEQQRTQPGHVFSPRSMWGSRSAPRACRRPLWVGWWIRTSPGSLPAGHLVLGTCCWVIRSPGNESERP